MKTDLQIQKDVMDELKWEPALDASEIGVSVKNGVVTLSGIVDTYLKKYPLKKQLKKLEVLKLWLKRFKWECLQAIAKQTQKLQKPLLVL